MMVKTLKQCDYLNQAWLHLGYLVNDSLFAIIYLCKTES